MVYFRMTGKTRSLAPIWINTTIVCELPWVADRIEQSSGVSILDSSAWSAAQANLTFYSDACPAGLGFWTGDLLIGCVHHITSDNPPFIFFLEALAVLSVLHYVADNVRPLPRRIAIFCDNTNTVDMFNSLCATPNYNPILLDAVNLSLDYDFMFRVFHVPGVENTVADALSRGNIDIALQHSPMLNITTFEPPRFTLGPSKK